MANVVFSPSPEPNMVLAAVILDKQSIAFGVPARTLELARVLVVLRDGGFVVEALALKAALESGEELACDLSDRVTRLLFDSCLA